MLSITTMSAGSAISYHIHLQKDGQLEDYYASEGTGKWHGAGAENFGLSGDVKPEDFKALANGYDPKTGEVLTQNSGEKDRVAGYDLTFSAPKSVSIVKANSNDSEAQKIQDAHNQAVATALQFIQDKAGFTRTGHNGINKEETDLTIATFNHQTSREQDPQIHTHAFVFNVAERADGSTGAIDGHQFYQWKMAAGAVYRAELAYQLKERGYSIEKDKDSFRITSISKQQEREFSTRRNQIEKALKDAGARGAKASEVAALSTRKVKEIKDPEQLKNQWREQSKELGINEDTLKSDIHKTPYYVEKEATKNDVLEKMVENKSIVREQDIYKTSAIEAVGTLSGKEAIALAEAAKQEAVQLQKMDSHGNAKGEIKYTTEATIERESHIVEMAKNREFQENGLSEKSVNSAIENSKLLSAEQAQVVKELSQDGGIKVLIGDAGTGKSTTLETVKNAYENDGWNVIGAAPTGKAAAGLEEGTGIQSSTLHKLERELEKGNVVLTDKTVLVIDEAGMAGSKQMERVLEKAEEANAKVILAGDYKQLQSVEAGAAFRDISKEIETSRLSEIHRQKDDSDKQAVADMSRGNAEKAMAHYIEKGQVEVAKSYEKAIESVASKAIENMEKGGSSIAIASTNKQVRDINNEVREQLKERGELQDAQKVTTNHGKLELATDDRVLFTRNNDELGVKNGDLATVNKVEKDRIEVTIDRTGETKSIDTKEYGNIEHGYAVTTHKAQGVTVDNTAVYASADMSRELAYVQASRASESTNFVVTESTVNKLSEQAKPTEEMTNLAEKIEAQRVARSEEPSLPDNYKESFKATREYLNENSYSINERETTKHEEQLEQFKDTLKAMATSKQNESTRDYQGIEKTEQKEASRYTENVQYIDYKNGDFVIDPTSLPEPKNETEREFKAALEKEVKAMDQKSERVENSKDSDNLNAVKSIKEEYGSVEKATAHAQKLEAVRVERGEEPSLQEDATISQIKDYLDKHDHKFDKSKLSENKAKATQKSEKQSENKQQAKAEVKHEKQKDHQLERVREK